MVNAATDPRRGTSPPAPGESSALRDRIENYSVNFEPDLYSGEDAAKIVKAFFEIVTFARSVVLRASLRAEEASVHKAQAHTKPGSWLAEVTGTPVGRAANDLELARQMKAHRGILEGFAQGRFSEEKAKEIVTAAERAPEQESALVKAAEKLSLDDLKRKCKDVRAAATKVEDEVSRHQRIHKQRSMSMWVDQFGVGRIDARMTPDALARVEARLRPFHKAIFADARTHGKRESDSAYMVDALLAMAEASGKKSATGSKAPYVSESERTIESSTSGRQTPASKTANATDKIHLVHIRVDLSAILRGTTEGGETCFIPGINSPIPVWKVREILPEAILELVVTRGKDVTTVCTDSRYISAALDAALNERDQKCVVPWCNVRHPLQRHHFRVDFAKGGKTSLDNVARVCASHHHMLTNDGWVLLGPPGDWKMVKGDGSEAGSDQKSGWSESESEGPAPPPRRTSRAPATTRKRKTARGSQGRLI